MLTSMSAYNFSRLKPLSLPLTPISTFSCIDHKTSGFKPLKNWKLAVVAQGDGDGKSEPKRTSERKNWKQRKVVPIRIFDEWAGAKPQQIECITSNVAKVEMVRNDCYAEIKRKPQRARIPQNYCKINTLKISAITTSICDIDHAQLCVCVTYALKIDWIV